MRWMAAVVLALVVGPVSACSSVSGGASTADCATLVDFDGAVYTETGGLLDLDALSGPSGTGRESVCEDSGPDAAGSVFTDASRSLDVFQLPGIDPETAIGASVPGREPAWLAVVVGTPQEEIQRIVHSLRDAQVLTRAQ